MEYQQHQFANGIRLIHKQVDGLVAHCGIYINTGSRFEEPNEQGIAHLIEHMIFKGTSKRKAYHVLSRLDDVGGDLNAYTTKEETCIFASFLKEHYDRAAELICDITFNSTFPEKELEKEKEVVLDEINSYLDNPSEAIFDEFEEQVLKGHPLGCNILGSKDLINKYCREDLIKFIENNYFTNEIIFCSLSPHNFNFVKKTAEKYIANIPQKFGNKNQKFEIKYNPEFKTYQKSNFQSHCMIGGLACDIGDDKRTTMILLNNILGGPGMNTRLNLNIREKYGFCYNIESNYTPYYDTGIFCVYLGTDKEYIEKSIELVYKELKKFRDQTLGTAQLHKAKKQIIGQIAISQQNNAIEMLSLGKSLLLFDRVDTLDEIYKKFDSVSSQDLLEMANSVFAPENISTLIYTTPEHNDI